MDLDNLFVNSLLFSNKDVARNVLRHVLPEMVQGIERDVFLFTRDYYKNSMGSMPSGIIIKKKFPDFRRTQPKDDIHFYVDELKGRREYEMITESITKVQNHLFAKDLDNAKKSLRSLNVDLVKVTELDEAKNAKETFSERTEKYYEAKKNKGIIGMQTGLSALDLRLGGITDEMFVIMGLAGIGKTFMLLMIGNALWRQVEGNVVFITNELSKEKILGRLDSVVAKVNYSRYRKGQLSPLEEKKLLRLPKIYKRRHEFIVINGAGKSVHDLDYEISSYEPALLLVDGLYLTDMGHNDEYKNTSTASRAYQRLLKRLSIPGILTTQMDEEDRTKYARAIKEDCDILLKMYQSPALHTDKKMGLEFQKIREEESYVKAYNHWDFDKWNFEEYDINEAEEDYEQEYE